MSAAAYILDPEAGPIYDDDWTHHAACRDQRANSNWWFREPSTRHLRLAAHICQNHCPVRELCDADARHNPTNTAGTVLGGVYYAPTPGDPTRGTAALHQPAASSLGCRWCPTPPGVDPAATTDEQIIQLREAGLSFVEIAYRIGCTVDRARYLYRRATGENYEPPGRS